MAEAPNDFGRITINLENCKIPFERLHMTPSMKEGLPPRTEYNLRILGCELLQHAGVLLKLPQVAMACAQVLFQRYYYSKSFLTHDFQHAAMACLYIASKIEECFRKLREIINVFHHIKQKKLGRAVEPLDCIGEQYLGIKSKVINMERRVLKELGFCVHVKHPHKIIVVYLQFLEMDLNQSLAQQSWNYMNDGLRTTIFVRHSPESIAAACIFLAARVLQIPLPKSPGWWEVFRVNIEDIEDIAMSILELYQTHLPSMDELTNEVKKFAEQFQSQVESN